MHDMISRMAKQYEQVNRLAETRQRMLLNATRNVGLYGEASRAVSLGAAAIGRNFGAISQVTGNRGFIEPLKTMYETQNRINEWLETRDRLASATKFYAENRATANWVTKNNNQMWFTKGLVERFSSFTPGDIQEALDFIEKEENIDYPSNDDIINSDTIIGYVEEASKTAVDNKTFLRKIAIPLIKKFGQAAAQLAIWMVILHAMVTINTMHDIKLMKKAQFIIEEEVPFIKHIYKLFVEDKRLEVPISQMAYTKVSTYLREGPKKTTPVVTEQKLGKNQVVILLERDDEKIERKSSWVKVYFETDEDSGAGWIEESKLIKFKRE